MAPFVLIGLILLQKAPSINVALLSWKINQIIAPTASVEGTQEIPPPSQERLPVLLHCINSVMILLIDEQTCCRYWIDLHAELRPMVCAASAGCHAG